MSLAALLKDVSSRMWHQDLKKGILYCICVRSAHCKSSAFGWQVFYTKAVLADLDRDLKGLRLWKFLVLH